MVILAHNFKCSQKCGTIVKSCKHGISPNKANPNPPILYAIVY